MVSVVAVTVLLGMASGYIGVALAIAIFGAASVVIEIRKILMVAAQISTSEDAIIARNVLGAATVLRWSDITEIRRFSVSKPLVTFEVVRLLSPHQRRQIVLTSLIEDFQHLMRLISLRIGHTARPTRPCWWEKLLQWDIL